MRGITDRRKFYRRWWLRKCAEHQGELFFAKAPVRHADPRKVEHLFSAVFEEGFRTFAFKSRTDRFVFTGSHELAQSCENPCNE